MTNEDHILSQILFYDELHHYLPKINPQWFEDVRHQKYIKVLTKMYIENKSKDMVQFAKHLTRPELLDMVHLQHRVNGMPRIESHLRIVEYQYIKKQFVLQLQTIDLKLELADLVKQTQDIIDATTFTTLKDPKPIIAQTSAVVEQIIANAKAGTKLTGRPTGWRFLDKYLGGYNIGDLIVMAGRPGMGKTAIALTLVKDFAAVNGKALFLSLEMSNEQLTRRYVSLLAQIANYKMRNGTLSDWDLSTLQTVANQQFIQFFTDDEAVVTVADIRGKAKLHKAKHGLELLVIDYIQLIKGNKVNREQEIADISRNLKLLAKELHITIIVLAQLSRKSEDRADKRPMLSDLRESGAIEQDADIVMFPFRPAYYDKEKPDIEDAELIIGKNRNGECANIPVTFNGALTEYKEDYTDRA